MRFISGFHHSFGYAAALGLGVMLGSGAAWGQTARPVLAEGTGSPVMYPSFITEYDGLMYFRGTAPGGGADAELWRSDGITAQRVADIRPGSEGSSPSYLAVYNGKLYFSASGATGGTKLWQYDSLAGTSLAPGSAAQAGNPEELTAYGGNLYYRAFRSNIGVELWRFDGVNQTPIDLFPGSGSSYPQHFIQYNGQLHFNANGTPGQGTELWRYNGGGMPTEVARIYPNNGSSPEQFAVYQGQLYFSAYDGAHGRELWRYNGSTASMAADIVPGGTYSSSNPSGMVVYGDKLYFAADDGIHGYELWSFDGTNARMVAEINPTLDPGNGDTFLMDSSPAELTVWNDVLYFSANDGEHGRELWSYDGDRMRMVLDINPGEYGSEVSELTVYNGQLYFSADNGYVPGLTQLQPTVFALAVPEPAMGMTLLLAAGLLLRRHRKAGVPSPACRM